MTTFLSVNYMIDEIEAKGVDIAKQEFAVLAVNDFDPTGYNIGDELVHQLQACGVRNFRLFEQYSRKDYPWFDLVRPQTLAPALPPDEDIDDHTYLIHKRFRKKPDDGGEPWAKIWARTTGGVDGKGGRGHKWEQGIEADEYKEAHLTQLIAHHIQPLLSVPAAVVQRRLQMRELEEVLGKYLVYRMTQA